MDEQERRKVWEETTSRFASCVTLAHDDGTGRGKRCFEKGWTEYTYKPNRPAYEQHRGLGIVCGPSSGVWVIDVDDVEKFDALVNKMNPVWDYRNHGLVHGTASGKYHVMMKWNEQLYQFLGAKSAWNSLANQCGFELLFAKKLSVAPPTGLKQKDGTMAYYTVEHAGELNTELPEQFMNLIVNVRLEEGRSEQRRSRVSSQGRHWTEVTRTMLNSEKYCLVTNGKRDNSLTKILIAIHHEYADIGKLDQLHAEYDQLVDYFTKASGLDDTTVIDKIRRLAMAWTD